MKDARPLAIDFDDIVFDFHGNFREFHHRNYGSTYAMSDIYTYDMAQFLGLSEEEKNFRVLEFYFSGYQESGFAIPGAIDALHMLAEYHSLHMVTARPLRTVSVTESWLDSQGVLQLFAGRHYTNSYLPEPNSPVARRKSDICVEIGAAAHIEDASHHASDVAAAGIPVYLLDKPWNRGPLAHSVTRFNSWSDITRHIAALKSRR